MLRFITLIAYICIALAQASTEPRISGGTEPPSIASLPYQVSIHAYNAYQCVGAIISADWVLTTVHCLRRPRDAFTVRAGSAELHVGGSVHHVARLVNHERYVSQLARFNDVALVKVEPPFELDETRRPVQLVDAMVSLTEGTHGVISGWSREEGEPKLKAVTVGLTSLANCVETYHSRFGNLQPGILCARNNGTGAACSEIIASDDSGAPLVVDGRLAGVFSWGYRCHEPGFPSVFTEVAFFREWIKRNAGI